MGTRPFTCSEERQGFERLFVDLSARLINSPADQIYEQIKAAQKIICESFGFDGSSLAERDEATGLFLITQSYVMTGFASSRGMTSRTIPSDAARILRGDEIPLAHIFELPEGAAVDVDKEAFRSVRAKCAVSLPLGTGGQVFGFLGFGNSRLEREWPEPLVGRLRLIADAFANAVARKRFNNAALAKEQALIESNERLQEANRRIDNLKERLDLELACLQEEITLERTHAEIIGQSQAIRRVLMNAEQVAATDSTVLLLGETGTGKELVAKAIHRSSKRKDRLMVKVNCAALPASLVENELFGRERGAYTGALTREIGRFELANESTIFLDEIGELPLESQAKLLRVLQEGEFERLGSSKTIHVDARLVAATSRDLETAVKEGKFREDLYYRLNVFPIRVPPLRERREDIPMLTWHFLRELGGRMGRDVEAVRATTMKAFQGYSWPGNVRELRNVIERSLITHVGKIFEAELPGGTGAAALAGSTMEGTERNNILRTLEHTGWRVRGRGGAAETLGLKPTTMEARMKKLGISRK